MTTTRTRPTSPVHGKQAAGPAAMAPQANRPIVGWAVFGVAALIVEAVTLSGWVTSGDMRSTPTGATPVPTYMKIGLHTWEVVGVLLGALVLHHFVIKPWRRERRITTDGLLCLAFLTVAWQDAGLNYFQVWSTYNAEFINLGSWYTHIPGWLSPNANLNPEPLVWVMPLYIYMCFGITVLNCWVFRQIRARRPRTSNLGLLGACLALSAVADLLVEPFFCVLGVFSYPGAVKGLTLFYGEYYQFPVYEPILLGTWITALTCLRWFKNDKGETIAERGLSELRSPRRQTWIRFLALTGAVNAAFLVYNVPASISGIYAGNWPEEIQSRSYFTVGICGPGTDYACSGPAVPIPRTRGSAHIGADGNLVVPPGTEVPTK